MVLINKAIEMEWKDPTDEASKPAWMPRLGDGKSPHKCRCKHCFFCLKEKKVTKKKAELIDGLPKGCVKDRVAVTEPTSLPECAVCVHLAKKNHPGKTVQELRKLKDMFKVSNTHLGCPGCDKTVCKDHWKEHTHQPKDCE